VHHLEHAERHALEHDVLADHAGDEVALVDLLEQHLGEPHQVRVGEVVDGALEIVLRNTQVVESLGEDLDVAGLVQGLGRQEALAREVRRDVDQPGGGRQRAAFADHELHRGLDGLVEQLLVVEEELRLLLAHQVSVLGVFQIALGAGLEPVLDGVARKEISHDRVLLGPSA
jgi:hypothetical protein